MDPQTPENMPPPQYDQASQPVPPVFNKKLVIVCGAILLLLFVLALLLAMRSVSTITAVPTPTPTRSIAKSTQKPYKVLGVEPKDGAKDVFAGELVVVVTTDVPI